MFASRRETDTHNTNCVTNYVIISTQHKLLKEQNLTRLNQSKLIEKWRHVLRDAKSQELSRELEV